MRTMCDWLHLAMRRTSSCQMTMCSKPLVWTRAKNAKVCVFDNTYYKITTTNYISMYPSGPWSLKILMFALLVTHEIATYNWPWEKTRDYKYMLGLLLILISKSWGVPPWPGMPFLDSDTCAGGLFISARVFFLVWCHPWMDGWKASEKTTTTSFTICNKF